MNATKTTWTTYALYHAGEVIAVGEEGDMRARRCSLENQFRDDPDFDERDVVVEEIDLNEHDDQGRYIFAIERRIAEA